MSTSPLPKESSSAGQVLANPPGSDLLLYRAGVYDSFLEDMLDRIMSGTPLAMPAEVADALGASRVIPPGAAPRRSIRFNTVDDDNWVIALLKSWATVCDVLTFYQERLLQEGFLRTAVERVSVFELVKLINYKPRPGVAGSAALAFTATEVPGLPTEVELGAGTVVTSVPPPGAESQSFETQRALEASADWNLVEPVPPLISKPPVLDGTTTELKLATASSGLVPGSPVLIQGRSDDEPRDYLVFLTKVESGGDPPATVLTWSPPLDPDDEKLRLTDVAAMALRQQVGLFGSNAPLWSEQSSELQRQKQPLQGGVLVSSPEGWRSRNRGLPVDAVACLAIDHDGFLYAGTATAGVYRSARDGETWVESSRGLQQLDIHALVVDPQGFLLAGTSAGGVYRSTDRGEVWELVSGRQTGATVVWPWSRARSRQGGRLPPVTVRALVAMQQGQRREVFAGTDGGIFRSSDLGATWLPVNDGLPGTSPETGETDLRVGALAAGPGTGVLYAGTPRGVFVSNNRGRRWRPINRGLPETDPFSGLSRTEILALVFYRDARRSQDYLFATTASGIWRSVDGGESWHTVNQGLPGAGSPAGVAESVVQHLVHSYDPITVTTKLLVGGSQGLWGSEDHGASWVAVDMGRPAPVQAVALAGGTRVVATPLAGFAENEWPGFFLHDGEVDFDHLVQGITVGSVIALHSNPGGGERVLSGTYVVKGVSTVQRSDFSLTATVTRALVEPDEKLAHFNLRQTRAFVQSEALPVLDDQVPDEEKEARTLTELAERLNSEGLASRPVIVVARERSGVRRPAAEESGELESRGAVSKPVTVARLTTGEGLAMALSGASREPQAPADQDLPLSQWDRTTLKIYGNVVTAEEGTRIVNEVLGDGDATVGNQGFWLQRPLTFRRSPQGPRATLELRVRGQLWDEVSSFYRQPPDARVYRIHLDSQGRAKVIFGDGVEGSRLPSGRGVVTATYRTGMSSRSVGVGGLSIMQTRPLGLAAVTNPIASEPGAEAQATVQIRRLAPLSVRTLGRIVSLQDYEDYARDYPGVAKAGAWSISAAGRKVVQITLAGEDGRAPGQALMEELLGDMEEIRGGQAAVRIAAFVRVDLHLAAGLRVDSRYRWDDVRPRVLEALMRRFSFEASRFCGRVAAAEVVRVAQSVPGVVAVDLDEFSPATSDHPLELRALEPRWDGKRLLAAELILLEEENIRLYEAKT